MQKFRDRQFTARYNRIMLVTFGVVLLISLTLVGIQVRNQARHDDEQLTQRFKVHANAIDNLLVKVTQNLNLLQGTAQSFYLDAPRDRSRLFAALSDVDAQGYSLDRIPAPYEKVDVGNLTGSGPLAALSADTEQEVEMALSLNRVFRSAQANIPNANWLYYTSKRGFINIYPWEPCCKHRYDAQLHQQDFYTMGLPDRNPDGAIRWTTLYHDLFGKGMMVTASKPVYQGKTFLGVVSIDLNLDELTRYVHDFSGPGGALMIVNAEGQLLAHPEATSSRDERAKAFAEFLPAAWRPAVDDLFRTPEMTLRKQAGQAYIWKQMALAPWKIVYITEAPNGLVQAYSNSGLAFVVLLGGLTVMLVTMRMITFREFIEPAERLVRHIFLESQATAGAPGPMPQQWRPWFEQVSSTFRQNRELVQEINQKNQQLTDMNISLERYTPKFILLLSLREGGGSTTIGHYFADILSSKDSSKASVYMAFPQPERIAAELQLDASEQVVRHPNGYDIWTAYDLGQVPAAGLSSLLMAKVLHKYHNVVICATATGPTDAFIDQHLEPMFRYAKAIVLMLPPEGSSGAAIQQTVRQIKRSVRQDQTNVYILQNRLDAAAPPDPQADFEIPFLGAGVRVTQQPFQTPAAAAAVIGRLVDRVERVHQVAAFIPTTAGVNRPVDTSDHVQRTMDYFSQRFGGATSSQAQGAWNSEAAGIVNEVVHVVVSYTTEEDLSRHVDDLIEFIKGIKRELGQEAMAIEINKKLMLV